MGIYLEQKYNLPKITKTMDEIAEYLKKNEKQLNTIEYCIHYEHYYKTLYTLILIIIIMVLNPGR